MENQYTYDENWWVIRKDGERMVKDDILEMIEKANKYNAIEEYVKTFKSNSQINTILSSFDN